MNDNRKLEIHAQPGGGFAVVIADDEMVEPFLSIHPNFEDAITEALALQKAGEFKGSVIVDHTKGGER